MISLPLPPSVNAMFRNVVVGDGRKAGRIKTAEYTAWRNAAGLQLKAQRPDSVSGAYRLEIHLPLRMRGDISNRIKGLEDLLVECGVTPDDSLAHEIVVRRSEMIAAGWCQVRVSAA